MLYRLLGPNENWQFGLSAKNALSDKTVFKHVTTGSRVSGSKFISTCGSLNAMLRFTDNCYNSIKIVKIWEKNLPVVKNDLRTKENWGKYCAKHNGSVNNDGCKFDEVLLVGYIPKTHVELLTNSDFPA